MMRRIHDLPWEIWFPKKGKILDVQHNLRDRRSEIISTSETEAPEFLDERAGALRSGIIGFNLVEFTTIVWEVAADDNQACFNSRACRVFYVSSDEQLLLNSTEVNRNAVRQRDESSGSTMFIESELTWRVFIGSCSLKSDIDIQDALLIKLREDFDEVRCSESHGYHICVTTIEEISEEKAWDSNEWTAYSVRFRCLTYKPVKDETGPAVVTVLNKETGAICSLGPMDMVFVPFRYYRDEYEFIPGKESIPDRFQGNDGTVIEAGSVLRVQIVDVEYNPMFCEYEAICMLKGTEQRTSEHTPKPQPDGYEDGSGEKVNHAISKARKRKKVENAGGSDDSPSVLEKVDTSLETESFTGGQHSVLREKSVKLSKGKGAAKNLLNCPKERVLRVQLRDV
ncbi:hypothetical protein R1sor_026504 [Riccia sorocarpa]|uniref:Uncharacterized protein n=1 Tax=Riccia sorocarpa TaxID=122646 RepID=A0ABD3GF82_9MARC